MRKNRWRGVILTAVGLALGAAGAGLSAPAQAAEESPFLLQSHGGVRIMRGLSEEKNFEPAKLAAEEEAEAPGEEPAPAARRKSPAGPSFGGIITHRMGGAASLANREAQRRLANREARRRLANVRSTRIRYH